MNIEKAKEVTRKVIRGDMILNWFLGFVFLLFFKQVENLIATENLLSPYLWIALGVGFLGFAAWQLRTLRQGKYKSQDYVFAAIMALVPVVLLTIALFMDFPLKNWARVVLWIGNIYMLLLGSWYLFLAKQS